MLGTLNVHVDEDTFEPGVCSIPELHFILDNLGTPPVAAFEGFDPVNNPKHRGVIRSRATTVLARLYDLEQLQQYRQVEWAGRDAIEDSITRYLGWHDRVQEMKRRGFRRGEPSQFHWDEVGEPYKFAIGADSAELVRTEILNDGTRKPFAVKLTQTAAQAMKQDLSDVAPWINRGAQPGAVAVIDKLLEKVKGRMGTIECTVCGKVEEFDSANRQKRMAARGRMAKHLKNAKQELHRHRLLLRKEFK